MQTSIVASVSVFKGGVAAAANAVSQNKVAGES